MPTTEDVDVSKDAEADLKAERDGADSDAPSDAERQIDADPALSPAAEQGGAALSNLGQRRGSELFRKD
jgi:hypothetical protein